MCKGPVALVSLDFFFLYVKTQTKPRTHTFAGPGFKKQGATKTEITHTRKFLWKAFK